jgi:DNA invertase Pin-like site-specific DNA recombinase
MPKKVIELVRVSTESQAAEDRAGIPAQKEANRRTAAQYGLDIVKTIQITDVSGTAVLRSPGMQELLRNIESPDIHGVIAKEFSRLMRPENFADYALLQQFIDTHTVLYLPDGPLDFASEAGKLLAGIRALIAGQERREMLRRLRDAKESIRRAGKNAGGISVLPYGVGYSEKAGWYYTPEIEKVKRAFQLFLRGNTNYQSIGRELNIPRTSVKFMIMNPIYTGWRVYDQRRDPSPEAYFPGPNGRQGYRKKMQRTPDEIIRVRVLEPIIDESDFARAQEMIETKRLRHWRGRGEAPNRYTYNGFLICGDCQELIYTHTGTNSEFYACKSRNPRERRKRALRGLLSCENKYMLRKKLEPRIDHVLSEMLCQKEFLEPIVNAQNEKTLPESQAADQVALNVQIGSLREKRKRVLETFYEGLIDKHERNARVEDVEKEIAVYQRLLFESAGSAEEERSVDVNDVLAIVEPFAEWAFLNRDQKRTLLEHLCPEISVLRYEIRSLQLNLIPQAGSGYKDSPLKTATSPSRESPCRSPSRRDSCWRPR